MAAVHSLQGVGALIVNDERHAGTHYRIDIVPIGRNRLRARGSLDLAASENLSLAAISAAFNQGRAVLELQDGGTVEIVPDHFNVSTGQDPTFTFVVSGAVPGFDD
jgi:hypothetical protein